MTEASPFGDQRVSVIIPAIDEEASIGLVLDDLPQPHLVEVIVADNGSTDRTAEVAREHGARVVEAPVRGYGSACLAGIAALDPSTDIVVFLDGDYSDHPEEITEVAGPIVRDEADLVIGSRATGESEPGSLLPQQRFGNWLATFLIRVLWRHRYTDLGPFRAIRRDALDRIEMADPNFGWTVEMQIKAIEFGLRTTEVPVRYRKRVGTSKIAGTISGSVRAGHKILSTIGTYWIAGRGRRSRDAAASRELESPN